MRTSTIWLITALCWIAPTHTRIEAAEPVVLKIPQKEIARRRGPSARAGVAVFSPDDRFVFVGVCDDIVVFRVDDGSVVKCHLTREAGEPQVGVVSTGQLIENQTKLLTQHWNPFRFVIWDVQALIDGRDAEPFLLFPNGDPYHSRCYRFEVLGTWDPGRLVVFEYYLPEEASKVMLRKEPGPRTVRLRLRRWKDRSFEPDADVDLPAYDMIFTAKQRSEDGLRVAVARGNNTDVPRDWHRMTVCWKDGRGQIESDQATTADEAMRWIGVLPAELDSAQIARWLSMTFFNKALGYRLLAKPARTAVLQHRNRYWITDPPAQRLAIGSVDILRFCPRPVVLVDLQRNRQMAMLPTTTGLYSQPLAFSHNGKWLITTTELEINHRDGCKLLLWNLPSPSTSPTRPAIPDNRAADFRVTSQCCGGLGRTHDETKRGTSRNATSSTEKCTALRDNVRCALDSWTLGLGSKDNPLTN